MNELRTDDPRLLMVDTSGRVGVVAVAWGDRILGERRLEETRRHARDLAPSVAELCRAAGWRVRELDGVIVSIGPGSYTGLRVGIISAKTLAYATGCVVLAIPTFRVIVEQSPAEARVVDVLADAQQGLLYAQRFHRHDEGWRDEELRIIKSTDWRATLSAEVWVSGPGLSVVEDELPPSQPRVSREDREARAATLLRLGRTRWQHGESDDLWKLEPLYLRPSNAEENWERRQATN